MNGINFERDLLLFGGIHFCEIYSGRIVKKIWLMAYLDRWTRDSDISIRIQDGIPAWA